MPKYDIKSIDEGIKRLNKTLKICVDRKTADTIISEIHDMRWDLETIHISSNKTDWKTYNEYYHKLKLLEGRVCVKAGAILDKLIEEKHRLKERKD